MILESLLRQTYALELGLKNGESKKVQTNDIYFWLGKGSSGWPARTWIDDVVDLMKVGRIILSKTQGLVCLSYLSNPQQKTYNIQ